MAWPESLRITVTRLAGSLLAATSVVGWRSLVQERQRKAADIARQRDALARRFNPYVSGEPVREPSMFYGRDELLHRIADGLHQNSIMVHGERRMGKTSLLYRLAQQLREVEDPEWVFVPVLIDLQGTSQDRFFYALMEAIWGVLAAYLIQIPLAPAIERKLPAEYTDRDLAADLRLILKPLKDLVAPRHIRIVLLIDEIDIINSYDPLVQQQFRRILMSPLAQNLGAVVAGVQISKVWDRVESPWYNLFNDVALEPFSREQAIRLLTEPVKGVYSWDTEALDLVVRHAQGRPYRLQQYGLEAVNHMLAERRLQITEADVIAAHEAIGRAQAE